MTHHDALWGICRKMDSDYAPYGVAERDGDDCSCGCVWFYNLAARGKENLGQDWGICANPVSHRCALLTYEHQGCRYFEAEK